MDPPKLCECLNQGQVVFVLSRNKVCIRHGAVTEDED